MKIFIRQAFSESDGTGSFGRLATAILFFFELIWMTWSLYQKGTFPDPLVITALGAFAMLPYGTAKVSSTIQEVKNPTPPPPSG